MVSAFDPGGDDHANEVAISLAFDRLAEVEAISVTFDDETDTATVEPTPLLSAVLSMLTLLIGSAAESHNTDTHAVIVTLREHLDPIL